MLHLPVGLELTLGKMKRQGPEEYAHSIISAAVAEALATGRNVNQSQLRMMLPGMAKTTLNSKVYQVKKRLRRAQEQDAKNACLLLNVAKSSRSLHKNQTGPSDVDGQQDAPGPEESHTDQVSQLQFDVNDGNNQQDTPGPSRPHTELASQLEVDVEDATKQQDTIGPDGAHAVQVSPSHISNQDELSVHPDPHIDLSSGASVSRTEEWLRECVESLNEKLVRLTSERQELEGMVHDLETERDRMQVQLSRSEACAATVSAGTESLRNELSAAHQQVRDLQQATQVLTAERDNLQKQHETSIQNLQAKINLKTSLNSSQRTQYLGLLQEANDAKDALQTEVLALRGRLVDLERRHHDEIQQYKMESARILQNAHESYQSHLDHLQQQKEAMHVAQLRDAFTAVDEDLVGLMVDMSAAVGVDVERDCGKKKHILFASKLKESEEMFHGLEYWRVKRNDFCHKRNGMDGLRSDTTVLDLSWKLSRQLRDLRKTCSPDAFRFVFDKYK